MQRVLGSRVSHAGNNSRPPLARTRSPVADDPSHVAAQLYAMSTDTDRVNMARMQHLPSMRHTRALRYSRWERLMYRLWGRWPESVVNRRLDAELWDEIEAKAQTLSKRPV